MTIIISIPDIDILKSKLYKLIPEVQSSHRVEAMARGLGWQTNAALRAALREQELERSIEEQAFRTYLASHGFSVLPLAAINTKPDLPVKWESGHQRNNPGEHTQCDREENRQAYCRTV